MIETKHLIIMPLDHRQLRLYLRANNKFEKEFRLSDTGRNISLPVKERVEFFILPQIKKATGDNYLFYTFWIVIEKTSLNIVAELGFKGKPNHQKEIEIGYGTFFSQLNKGIMTEAVGGMIDWAKARTDVDYILAETDEKNIASIRVLQKNNFQQFDKIDDMLWWKISVQ
ncbi:MAG: GNAT family N-acetyltransferase [Bacteroidetes bacterium]|nr:GNAT family N-acetyltransferase [Bacteroidota bacterium]